MYSKNPVTQKLDSYAFQSDLEKVDKLILKAGERGNVSQGTIDLVVQAEGAADTAATAASGAREAVDKLNTEDIPTAQGQYTAMYDKVYGTASDPGGLDEAVEETCETVQANEPVVAGVVGVTEKNTGDMNAFLDSYVATAVRIADPDQLQEIGAMAHEVNGGMYPYSHCETASELAAAGFVCTAEMNEDAVDSQGKAYKNNLMSLGSIVSAHDLTGSDSVVSWSIPLPNLTSVVDVVANGIFTNLTSFTGALPNLVNGGILFYNAKITSWNVELPSLVSGSGGASGGEGMFCRTDITSWNEPLPRLESARGMFQWCESLTDFNIGLHRLKEGYAMFEGCINLATVAATLPSLKVGCRMFSGCKLEFESACNILNSLPNVTNDAESDKTFAIGMYGSTLGDVTDETCCLEAATPGSGYTFKRRAEISAAIKKARDENGWSAYFVEQYFYLNGNEIPLSVIEPDPSLD